MRFTLLLFAVLLPTSAMAGDPGAGRVVYDRTCSQCHSARAFGKKDLTPRRRSTPPDLVEATRGMSEAALAAWVNDPWSVKADTRCSPQGVKPAEVSHLKVFLTAQGKPPPLSREERAKRSLEATRKQQLERARAVKPGHRAPTLGLKPAAGREK